MLHADFQQPRRTVVALLTFLTCLLAVTGAWANHEPGKHPSITLAPKLTTNESNLIGFTVQVGQVAKEKQSYRLDWQDIPAGQKIFINAPKGFEIGDSSDDDGTVDIGAFGDFSQSVIVVEARVEATNHVFIIVRLNGNTLPDTYTGKITHTSDNVATVDVAVRGTVTLLSTPGDMFVSTPLITLPNAKQGEPSTAGSYGLLIQSLLNKSPEFVAVTAPNDFEVSLSANGGSDR